MTAMTAAQDAPQISKGNAKTKSAPKAHPSDMSVVPEAHMYGVLQYTMRPEHDVKDALNPQYWSAVAHMLKLPSGSRIPNMAGSIIEVRKDDNSIFFRLFVRAVLERGLVVEIIKPDADGVCRFGPKQLDIEGYEDRWNVGKRGFDVLRKSDGEVVGDGRNLKTKEMAAEFIEKTLKVN